MGDHGLTGIKTTRCNIIQNTGYAGIEQGNTHKNSNIIDNTITTRNGLCYHGYEWYNFLPDWRDFNACNVYGNSIDFMQSYYSIACVTLDPTVVYSDYPSYLGTALEVNARKNVLDYYNELNDDVHCTTFGTIDLKNMMTQPSSEAHGIVWKILVNGKDAQDEYDDIAPLGVGTHRVDVYFNRPMDKSIQPWLSMGVRPPYTQTFINEEPSWNEEGTIYTAYITITAKSAFDGINRFYVADAQDLDHFTIPTERSRFNVPVGAAGSKSTGFMAEPGLGRVKLTWEAVDPEEVEDVMGYNMYRYTLSEEGISSDTTLVNKEIIEETGDVKEFNFTDYDVTPGTTYYYYYRALRSTLDSSEPSLTVAATPVSAQKGDANGSNSVTVADVVTEIDYLTNQNPQPFIFEAADVNSDEIINILDVVGTINLVLGHPSASMMAQSLATAEFAIEDGILYLDSPVELGGLQFRLTTPEGVQFVPFKALEDMEYVNYTEDEGATSLLMSFSLIGRTIPVGRHAILYVGDATLVDIMLSDKWGNDVKAIGQMSTAIETIVPAQKSVEREGLFDLMGRRVTKPSKGVYIINGKKVCY